MMDENRLQLASQRLRIDLQDDNEWNKMAQALRGDGYKMNDGEGITPIIFQKPDCDDLYLIRATVAGSKKGLYQIIKSDEIKPIQIEQSAMQIFLLPWQMPEDPKKTAYAWVPRRLADRPEVFSIRDVADHVAMSMVSIEWMLMPRKGRSAPVVVLTSSVNIPHRHLFTESDILAWYLSRINGRVPHNRHLSRKRLYVTGSRNLHWKLKNALIKGAVSDDAFRQIFNEVTGRTISDETIDPDKVSMSRLEMVEILTRIGNLQKET